MLAQVLTRMSNDEQRTQLLQALRHKLASYQLTWLDVRAIVGLFAPHNHARFDVVQLLLAHAHDLPAKIDVDDYLFLADQCTNDNEQLKVRLFELLHGKIDGRKEDDVERVMKAFPTPSNRQKIGAIIRSSKADEHPALTASPLPPSAQPIAINRILSPTLPIVEELSTAPLKRKHSADDQPLTPASALHENEFIQRQDLSPPVVFSSSSSSLSSSSDENMPIRTRSFMMAIKRTFERLKETSS